MLAVGLVGCSTVDRGPVEQCQDDSDCGTGLVCSISQGNICVEEELPPRAAIGLEIRDGDLRIELRGCDPEVTPELGGSELRVQRRSQLVRDYELSAVTRRAVANCGGNECAGVCDEDALTCTEPADVDFTLTLASRLGLSEQRTKKSYVGVPIEEGAVIAPVEYVAPAYEVDVAVDPLAHSARVLDVTPTGEQTSLSPFRRVLAEDAPVELEAVGALRCQRGVFGNPGGVGTLAGTVVADAAIEFRYAEAIASPSTVLGTGPSCSDELACPPGWACDLDAGRCGLDLRDVVAGSSTSDADGRFFAAWLYTYCEGILAANEPLLRDFTVTVTPPSATGLPTVVYALEQEFLDPPTDTSIRQLEIEGKLCLPNWRPPQTVEFEVVGEPVELTTTELGTYACCSTACLPSGDPDVEPTPPPSVDSCTGFDFARFETRWFNPDLVEWVIAGCVPTATYVDGANGRYRVEVAPDGCELGSCEVGLTPGDFEDVTRNYTVTITQLPGSVFQSQRFSVQVDASTEALPPFELLPRVMLRGTVGCATEDNCKFEGAEVRAERLRVDTDDNDLLGPFFHKAQVDFDGQFILPVDPGVYVVTALPAVGALGGPARFFVVDAREGSDEVEVVGGVPTVNLDDRLQLDDGILVRVSFEEFDVSTGVTPLDVGSWTAQNDFPADLDLNDPSTCYAADANGRPVRAGCSIRALRTNDVPLSLISKLVQFTARNRGAETCE